MSRLPEIQGSTSKPEATATKARSDKRRHNARALFPRGSYLSVKGNPGSYRMPAGYCSVWGPSSFEPCTTHLAAYLPHLRSPHLQLVALTVTAFLLTTTIA